MASTYFSPQRFSPQTWSQRVRQPVFIATALSLGLHGIVFAAMPFLGGGNDQLEEPESVGVVELSPEDMARLPDFAQNDALNPNNFNNPLATQDGLSPLPVPNAPPLGDLSGFDFSDPLSGLGSPMDLLPPIPVEGGLNSGFDNSSLNDSSLFIGSEPLPAPSFSGPPSITIPEPAPEAPLPLQFEVEQDLEEPEVDLDPMSPATEFKDEKPVTPADGPLAAAPTPLEPTAPTGPSNPTTPPVPPSATMRDATEDLLAMRDQKRALLKKYASDGTEALDGIARIDKLEELNQGTPVQFKPRPQPISLTLPQDFPKCAADVRSGLFAARVKPEGGAPEAVNTVDGTGIPALDEIAIAAIQGRSDFAGGIDDSTGEAVPAIYSIDVNFTDPAGGCTAP